MASNAAAQIKSTLSAASHWLIPYAIANMPSYRAADHHRRLAKALEDVEAGIIKRLMVFMPPRHGKSKLCSDFFPAWYLGRNPNKFIIAVTYAQDLADDWGRAVRDQLRDPLHGLIFPSCSLREDTQSVDHISTKQNGSYIGTGVGGAITGRGAHLLLIDDPVKNREEADSEVQRRKVKAWYTSTAYTRLMTDSAIVIVQTRWHEDDLSGWLLEEHASEGWTVIDMPAINDEGGALWPEAYPIERLRGIQRAIGPRDWSALYMQRPSPDGGGYFRDRDFAVYDDLPKGCEFYGTSDYAATEGGGDWTEHAVWAVDSDHNIHAVDWWSGRTRTDEWIEAQIDLMAQWKPRMWVGESGPIRRSIEPFLSKRMDERMVWCDLQWLPSIHSKEIRARGFQAMAGAGKVRFPRAQWADDLRAELMAFPAGRADNKVDACSLIARALEELVPGKDIKRQRYAGGRYGQRMGASWMGR